MALVLIMGVSRIALAATDEFQSGQIPANPLAAAQEDLRKAEKEFEQAGKNFSSPPAQNSPQKNGRATWGEMEGAAPRSSQDARSEAKDPRANALSGSPETGYAGTWTDPATGDIITSVIAPAPQASQTQTYPIIIEPQVAPDWGTGSGYGYGYGNSYGWQNGWQNGGPQWGVPPGSPGYAPPPPQYGSPQYGGPPGGWQRPPMANMAPRPPFPQNFNPSYRPLKPAPPHSWPGSPNTPNIWQPAQGGNPPPPGPPNISQNPSNPGSIWNPGGNMWQPGQRPPAQGSLPLAPPGASWGNNWGSSGWTGSGWNNGHWGNMGSRPPMRPGNPGFGGPHIQPRGGF